MADYHKTLDAIIKSIEVNKGDNVILVYDTQEDIEKCLEEIKNTEEDFVFSVDPYLYKITFQNGSTISFATKNDSSRGKRAKYIERI